MRMLRRISIDDSWHARIELDFIKNSEIQIASLTRSRLPRFRHFLTFGASHAPLKIEFDNYKDQMPKSAPFGYGNSSTKTLALSADGNGDRGGTHDTDA